MDVAGERRRGGRGRRPRRARRRRDGHRRPDRRARRLPRGPRAARRLGGPRPRRCRRRRGLDAADERPHRAAGPRPHGAAARARSLAVTGAAGAFGGYVVQLAKADGLTVVADASEADEELVRELGADVVVRRGDDVADADPRAVPRRRRRAGRRRGAGRARAAGGPGRRRGGHRARLPRRRARGTCGCSRRWSAGWRRTAPRWTGCASRPRTASLTLRVAQTFPAEQAAEAHRLLEARRRARPAGPGVLSGGARGQTAAAWTTFLEVVPLVAGLAAVHRVDGLGALDRQHRLGRARSAASARSCRSARSGPSCRSARSSRPDARWSVLSYRSRRSVVSAP